MKRLFGGWRDPLTFIGVRDPSAAPDGSPKKSRPAFTRSSRSERSPHAVHSSSSSDGSVVQTPDPDDDLRLAPSSRWVSWMAPKSSRPKSTQVAAADPRLPVATTAVVETSTESEDESDDYGEEPEAQAVRPVAVPRRAASVRRAQANLRAITLTALSPPPSSPPLLHLPSTPLFPRSINPARKLARVQELHAVLFRNLLLRRLEKRSLSHADNEAIYPFARRSPRTVPKTRPRRQSMDEEAVPDGNQKVRSNSRGLLAWLDRPCFEDRCVLWVWDAKGREVIMRGVIGTGKAVASLEFTEQIEALAGYGITPTPAPSSVPQPSRSIAPSPVALPSSKPTPILRPLRIAAPSASNEGSSPATSTPNPSTGPSTPVSAPPALAPPRKVLRFVPEPEPEDDEDNIPLGLQLRGKRHVQELERQAAQQSEEQDRKRKVLADEVKAARARREGSRSGMMHDVELERQKDHRANYARPAYDSPPHPRRIASEPDPRVLVPSKSTPSHPLSVSETRHDLPRPASTGRERMHTTSPAKETHHYKSRPSSFISERNGTAPTSLPRSSTMQNIEDEKDRRRTSIVSDSGSLRHRPAMTHPLQPPQFMMMPPPSVPVMPMYPMMPTAPPMYYMQAQMPHVQPALPASPARHNTDQASRFSSSKGQVPQIRNHETLRRSTTPSQRQSGQ